MEDLELAQAVLSHAQELEEGSDFTLGAERITELYQQLPFTGELGVEAITEKITKIFGKARNLEEVNSIFDEIYKETTKSLVSIAQKKQFVPLQESNAYKVLQHIRDKQSEKEGELKAEEEVEKADQVLESIDAAAEGEQEFQDAVIPDSEQNAPEESELTQEQEKDEEMLEEANVSEEEESVADKDAEVEGITEAKAEDEAEAAEPSAEAESDEQNSEENAEVEETETVEAEDEVSEESVDAKEDEIAEKISDSADDNNEPEVSEKAADSEIEAVEEESAEAEEDQSGDAEPAEESHSEVKAESQELESESAEPEQEVSPEPKESKKESDGEATGSSAEPEDHKRKLTEDAGGHDNKRRRVAVVKKRKPTQRALAWAKSFCAEQGAAFELDDPEVVIDLQEPAELEERIHDDEIESIQDLVLGILKTYADHTMANSEPAELEVPLATVDKWIKQLRTFP